MRRPVAHVIALLLVLMASAVPTSAQTPSPAPSPSSAPARVTLDEAIALVLAQDPRFADLPSAEEIGKTFGPIEFFRSQHRVVPTVGGAFGHRLAWNVFDRYAPSLVVEVILAEGCSQRRWRVSDGRSDVCAWRHLWLYRVTGDGTVHLLYDEGDPDVLACRVTAIVEGGFDHLDAAAEAGSDRLRDRFYASLDAAQGELDKARALIPSPPTGPFWELVTSVLDFQAVSVTSLSASWPMDAGDAADWTDNAGQLREALAGFLEQRPCAEL